MDCTFRTDCIIRILYADIFNCVHEFPDENCSVTSRYTFFKIDSCYEYLGTVLQYINILVLVERVSIRIVVRIGMW